MARFSASKDGLLMATDVAARGLDIEHVIHYQVPRTLESYIHRSLMCLNQRKQDR